MDDLLYLRWWRLASINHSARILMRNINTVWVLVLALHDILDGCFNVVPRIFDLCCCLLQKLRLLLCLFFVSKHLRHKDQSHIQLTLPDLAPSAYSDSGASPRNSSHDPLLRIVAQAPLCPDNTKTESIPVSQSSDPRIRYPCRTSIDFAAQQVSAVDFYDRDLHGLFHHRALSAHNRSGNRLLDSSLGTRLVEVVLGMRPYRLIFRLDILLGSHLCLLFHHMS